MVHALRHTLGAIDAASGVAMSIDNDGIQRWDVDPLTKNHITDVLDLFEHAAMMLARQLDPDGTP